LVNAIRSELDMIKKTRVCQTRLELKKEMPKLNKQKELILFRIVQESLHNIIKHAEAKNILVSVNGTAGTMELNILDDGKGFDPKNYEYNRDRKTGLGLQNMRNRARLINADFTIDSKLNSGTLVKLVLQVENKTE